MDWIKQNKFLSGFLLVVLVLGGGLGFLAFSAKGKYAQVQQDYTSKATELSGLQTQQPFPDQENVKQMQAKQKEHQAEIDKLHKDLIKAQIPLEPTQPEKFQDNLREAVRRLHAKAISRKVNLSKGDKPSEDTFYMGFDPYRGVPPKPEAAAPLQRSLKAVELALNIMIDSGVSALEEIRREPLPEEGIAPPPTSEPKKERERDKGKENDKGLVERHWIELTFVASEPQFRNFINDLISSKTQFFIPSSVSVANQVDKGPSKTESAPPPPPPPPGDPNPPGPGPNPQPPKQNVQKILVGDEKLKVIARIEIVNFAEPAPTK
jgi:hypothetical protein